MTGRANIRMTDAYGQTVLHIAAISGRYESLGQALGQPLIHLYLTIPDPSQLNLPPVEWFKARVTRNKNVHVDARVDV